MFESGERHAYPRRLHHETPSWCRGGAVFHIRLRVAPDNLLLLTQPDIAKELLTAAQFYHEKQRWWCFLFLLMPDHVHALLAFPRDRIMSRIVGDWKHYTAQKPGVRWQANYFDHRIRHHSELAAKYAYICRNPVVKELCPDDSVWPWVWRPTA
jgi:REP element-mobilizing transposase RayT